MSQTVRKNIGDAWTEVFGTNAVVEDELAREIEYRGGKVVKKSQLLKRLAQCKTVPSSVDFIRMSEGRNMIDTANIKSALDLLVQYADDKTYWRGLFNRIKSKEI